MENVPCLISIPLSLVRSLKLETRNLAFSSFNPVYCFHLSFLFPLASQNHSSASLSLPLPPLSLSYSLFFLSSFFVWLSTFTTSFAISIYLLWICLSLWLLHSLTTPKANRSSPTIPRIFLSRIWYFFFFLLVNGSAFYSSFSLMGLLYFCNLCVWVPVYLVVFLGAPNWDFYINVYYSSLPIIYFCCCGCYGESYACEWKFWNWCYYCCLIPSFSDIVDFQSGKGSEFGSHGGICAICLDKIVLQETALVKGCEHAYWFV